MSYMSIFWKTEGKEKEEEDIAKAKDEGKIY